VIKTIPEAGVDGVDAATTEIKVAFSKDMTDPTWSWSIANKSSLPDLGGKPHYNSDKRTCVLPVKLKPGTTYAIRVNTGKLGGFKDTAGRSAIPYLLVFKTKT
jgi:hypothetical protein